MKIEPQQYPGNKLKILFAVHYSAEYHEYTDISIVSALLKAKGYKVKAVQADYAALKAELAEPSIVICSVWSSAAIDYYAALLRALKKDHLFFSALCGSYPTMAPELIENEGIDGVCIGEPVFAVVELIDKLNLNESFKGVLNWWIKSDGNIYKNPQRKLIEDLDILPFADIGLLKDTPLFNPMIKHIIASRGCPFGCSYCRNSSYKYSDHARIHRKRSVENVIEEIVRAKNEHSLRFVVFNDAVFGLNIEWLRGFSESYEKNVRLPFYCNVRADLVTQKRVSYLSHAGCRSVSVGIETSDELSRNKVLGKNISNAQIENALIVLKRAGIRIRTTNIIGVPCSSMDADRGTIRFNSRCGVDFAEAFPLFYFPNTRLSQEAIGLVKKYPEELINLKYLFGVAVEFPFLISILKTLIRLPLRRIYWWIGMLWKEYCYSMRIYRLGFGYFLYRIRNCRKHVKIYSNM
jgi:anaerobic magnesium-protoporphyrin IX monomethyl ester cyclase